MISRSLTLHHTQHTRAAVKNRSALSVACYFLFLHALPVKTRVKPGTHAAAGSLTTAFEVRVYRLESWGLRNATTFAITSIS